VPTYQYTCTECGEPVEAVQKFTDAPLTVCAACGGRLRKVFSPVGIVFKGSGFYRTDSRNGASATAAATKEKASDSASSSSASGDSSSSNGNGNGSGSADKPAAKKTETASSTSKSSSSEKVA
jgi:putative FmdB family regulatory protein